MHKKEFGQAYCKDLLNRILKNFILHFSEFYTIFYKYYNLKRIFGIFKEKIRK
jgi:hypothetical protein